MKRAIEIASNLEILAGNRVDIHKMDDRGLWVATGERGTFEEVTPSGLINFNVDGKPRQCMPGGIGAFILE